MINNNLQNVIQHDKFEKRGYKTKSQDGWMTVVCIVCCVISISKLLQPRKSKARFVLNHIDDCLILVDSGFFLQVFIYVTVYPTTERHNVSLNISLENHIARPYLLYIQHLGAFVMFSCRVSHVAAISMTVDVYYIQI